LWNGLIFPMQARTSDGDGPEALFVDVIGRGKVFTALGGVAGLTGRFSAQPP
jgi:hypothetical protein